MGVEADRRGLPRWLVFREEPGGLLRKVPLDVIRGVQQGAIRLAGPREGYHITRLYPPRQPD